jgi:hypothetical protein
VKLEEEGVDGERWALICLWRRSHAWDWQDGKAQDQDEKVDPRHRGKHFTLWYKLLRPSSRRRFRRNSIWSYAALSTTEQLGFRGAQFKMVDVGADTVAPRARGSP